LSPGNSKTTSYNTFIEMSNLYKKHAAVT